MTKPIETHYAGCKFRSRLEARWAVFFDTLRIQWRYEPEGFEIECRDGETRRYLPDFWLPGLTTWVEVKGQIDAAELDRLCWIVADMPADPTGAPHPDNSRRGLTILLLSDPEVPGLLRDQNGEEFGVTWPTHWTLSFHKGEVSTEVAYFDATDTGPAILHRWEDDDGGNRLGDVIWNDSDGLLDPALAPRLLRSTAAYITDRDRLPQRITQAYNAARKARFEFGETPTTT